MDLNIPGGTSKELTPGIPEEVLKEKPEILEIPSKKLNQEIPEEPFKEMNLGIQEVPSQELNPEYPEKTSKQMNQETTEGNNPTEVMKILH